MTGKTVKRFKSAADYLEDARPATKPIVKTARPAEDIV